MTCQTGSAACISRRATFQSPSALSSHSAVSGFIEDYAFPHQGSDEAAFSFQRFLQFGWPEDDNIQGERMIDGSGDPGGGVKRRLAGLHNHQQINVALFGRGAH